MSEETIVEPVAAKDAAPESEEVVIRVLPPDAPASAEPVIEHPPAPACDRIAPQASDSESESEDEPPPREIRIPRRMAGVCDRDTWRKFVNAVFDTVVDVSQKILLPHEYDVMPNVRAMIEGMSFSTESSKFSTLGMDIGVPGATPQCIDLLGGLMRVTAKRAATNPEYAKLFADVATLKNHIEQVGAQVCALPHVQAWMVIAAASARADTWTPVMRRRPRVEDIDTEPAAAPAPKVDVAPAEEEIPVVRAGRKKRKRENE